MRLLATIGLLAAACTHHVVLLSQPVASPGVDTVTWSRASVALPARGDSAVKEYRGAFSSGFEVSWFEPCDAPGGDNLWWVTLSEEARLQRDSLLKRLTVRPTRGLAVQWLATLSPKMPMGAGQMGRGSRYMLVTRILALRPLDESVGACGLPSQRG